LTQSFQWLRLPARSHFNRTKGAGAEEGRAKHHYKYSQPPILDNRFESEYIRAFIVHGGIVRNIVWVKAGWQSFSGFCFFAFTSASTSSRCRIRQVEQGISLSDVGLTGVNWDGYYGY
jgi:hypothetical protein